MDLRFKSVLEAVCAFYGIHPSKITARGNRPRIQTARHVIIYVCRTVLNFSPKHFDAYDLPWTRRSTIIEHVEKKIAADDRDYVDGVAVGEFMARGFKAEPKRRYEPRRYYENGKRVRKRA